MFLKLKKIVHLLEQKIKKQNTNSINIKKYIDEL